MVCTLSNQIYKYEHGLTAAEQRAADVRAGEAAAALRRLGLRLVHHVRPARGAADAVTASGAAAPTRVPSSVR